MNKEVKTIFVWTDGDSSVGIGGESAEINADGDWLFATDEWEDGELETLRETIRESFAMMWDEHPHVMFDFENVEPDMDATQTPAYQQALAGKL
ncbi:hypothetical protein [uncultured Pseudodesulfovibrio sp.]|uniref:hypothetical protein n=1 Tax=uncultured Pseudodesulfovibrio sp. TaxID=2035858 RepID=UPI0029C78C24|nr:hypothetical protein [uncultured Pseudodesulfovibrio sp.]